MPGPLLKSLQNKEPKDNTNILKASGEDREAPIRPSANLPMYLELSGVVFASIDMYSYLRPSP